MWGGVGYAHVVAVFRVVCDEEFLGSQLPFHDEGADAACGVAHIAQKLDGTYLFAQL